MNLTMIGILAVLASTTGLSEDESGANTWGHTGRLPSVVNPVLRPSAQQLIALRGEWTFATDPQGIGIQKRWMAPEAAWPAARTILVPGCWESQGVGEPGISQPWDMNDRGPYPLRHVYMGSAWYRRAVSIPETWQNKRIWLKVGGVRSQGWFWVNGKPVAHDNTYCGVYKYDITDRVVPGQEATIVALVRNDVPGHKGSTGWRHRAGGLQRDVEIEATPDMRIDNAWVQADFGNREAEVHATVAFATETGRLKNPRLRVNTRPNEGEEPSAAGANQRAAAVVFAAGKQRTEVALRVPLAPFHPWSPEHPHLYVAELTLCDGDTPVHSWTERFGVRKLEVRADRFFLNGKPFLIRGYGDDHIYPLTLVSPASREEHRKHLIMARDSGFNYVRLHTHCELPEFYEAADEVGILVQAELPYNHAKPGEAFPSDPQRDLTELITHYRRYVSLATCCMGNEGGFPSPLDNRLYETVKRLDPGLLVLHHDGGNNTRTNSDFRSGPTTPWRPGSLTSDMPFVAHEYLNLSLKADPRLDDRFTGAYLPSLASLGLDRAGMEKVRAGFPMHMSDLDSAPRDLKSFEAELKRVHLSRTWGGACIDAGHTLQQRCQKQGIEAARLDPACDGYSFWTIVDVLYQSQGLFNVFWEPKRGGATPDVFRKYNGPTVLLNRDNGQRVAVSGETLKGTLWLSHFGEEPLRNAKIVWTLRTDTRTLVSASVDIPEAATGQLRELAPWSFTVPSLTKPEHTVLEARLVVPSRTTDGDQGKRSAEIGNAWDFWLFPKRTPQSGISMAATRKLHSALAARYPGLALAGTAEANSAGILIATEGAPEAAAFLAVGRRVVLLDRCFAPENVRLGWWLLGNQTGTAIARHPAFGGFPHDGAISPLWARILKRSEILQPDDGFCGAEPLMVGDSINGYSLYLCQAKVGKGRLLRACGLDVASNTPEGMHLLDALLGYARSGDFAPKASLDAGRLAARWQRHQQIYVGLNGWAKTLKADTVRSGHYFFGLAKSCAMTLPKGQRNLTWETLPVTTNGPQAAFTFRWLQTVEANEWQPKATARITVHLDGKPLLVYDSDIFRKEWTVRKAGTTLAFTGLDFTQNSLTGVMELSVPPSWVCPGKPCVLMLSAEHPSGMSTLKVIEVNAATFQTASANVKP